MSKAKPISKKSLLYFIPEVFNEKLDSDAKYEKEKKNKLQFDQFFFEFMQSKFKIKKLVKKHCEESIMSIAKYSSIYY